MNYQYDITTEHTLCNSSPAWLVVGNGSQIVSACDTQEEAASAIEAACPGEYGIEDSPWGCLEIVAPGATITRRMQTPRPSTANEQAKAAAEWSESVKGMPWLGGVGAVA